MSLRNVFRSRLWPLKRWLRDDVDQLLGRIASSQVRSLEVVEVLSDAEFRVTSQWGQDGIIDWLAERAAIPPQSRTFVEFGVESYREANTRFLLRNRNWRGLIMDGSAEMLRAVRQDNLLQLHTLTALPAFITRDNINDLLVQAGFHDEIGLLSIDIDGNDYWVWEAIQAVNPILVVCEYNAVFGDRYPVTIPYEPRFNRTRAHYSNLYFGTSIGALRRLANSKGYAFAGTTSAGNDAFFVRQDYADRFLSTSIRSVLARPSLFRESLDRSGQRTWLGGMDRLQEIAGLPVVNVETKATVALRDLGCPYSPAWLAAMGAAAPSVGAP